MAQRNIYPVNLADDSIHKEATFNLVNLLLPKK